MAKANRSTVSRRVVMPDGSTVAPVARARVRGVEAEALSLWREWVSTTEALSALYRRKAALRAELPDEVTDLAYVAVYKETRRLYSDDEIDQIMNQVAQVPVTPEKWVESERARLKTKLAERKQFLEAERDRTGWNALADELDRMENQQDNLGKRIRALRSTGPIAQALNLHVALYWSDALFCGDLEAGHLICILRDLLPSLPADMAARLAPLTNKDEPLKKALGFRACDWRDEWDSEVAA